MTKTEIIERLNLIAVYGNSKDNGYHYEVVTSEWVKYGKNRTYFSIVETRDNSKHYVKKDYGYYDNNADSYVGKANIDYDFGGNNTIEEIEAEMNTEAEIENMTAEHTEETTMKKFTVEINRIENGTLTEWDSDAIQDYIEAETAEEAIELAKDFIHNAIIDNGLNPDDYDYEYRAAEIIDGERGAWE